MSSTSTSYDKILKALKYIICPLYKANLITEAFIVGSVAKETASEESDIDIMIVNPKFEYSYNELFPFEEFTNINKVYKFLTGIGIKTVTITRQKQPDLQFYYQIYDNELFHIMPQQESESIKRAGEYIEVTKDFCDIIKIKL
jgi:predicted nucleotidyltransferase